MVSSDIALFCKLKGLHAFPWADIFVLRLLQACLNRCCVWGADRRPLPPLLSLSAGFTWIGRFIWRQRKRRNTVSHRVEVEKQHFTAENRGVHAWVVKLRTVSSVV